MNEKLTLAACKDQVARKYGYTNYNDVLDVVSDKEKQEFIRDNALDHNIAIIDEANALYRAELEKELAELKSAQSADRRSLSMNIVNQLFDLAEVPVEKRQQINDRCDEFVLSMIPPVAQPVNRQKVEEAIAIIDSCPVQVYSGLHKERFLELLRESLSGDGWVKVTPGVITEAEEAANLVINGRSNREMFEGFVRGYVHASTALNEVKEVVLSYSPGMAENYMRHDYREMYELWKLMICRVIEIKVAPPTEGKEEQTNV